MSPVHEKAVGGGAVTDDRVSARLLAWYDLHARALPWRVPPRSDAQPDAYRVWLSEVMSQQTTLPIVASYWRRFTARWPTVEALAAADEADVLREWAGLGYYARARNLHACARAVVALGGFPRTAAALRALPGIGDYTAGAIAAIVWGEPVAAVDGNAERVAARLVAEATPLPAARRPLRRAVAGWVPADRPGDFAPGADGPGRHDLHSPFAPLPALPAGRGVRGEGRGRSRPLPAQGSEEGAPSPHRHGLVGGTRRPGGAGPARGRADAGRHLGAALVGLGRPARRLAGRAGRADAGHGRPRLLALHPDPRRGGRRGDRGARRLVAGGRWTNWATAGLASLFVQAVARAAAERNRTC